MSQNGNQNPNQDNKQLSWSNPQNGSQQKPQDAKPQVKQEQKAPIAQTPAQKPVQKPASAPVMAAASNRSTAMVVGWLAIGVVAGVIIAWAATGLVRRSGSGTTAGNNEIASSTQQAAATSSLLSVASPQKAGLSVSVTGVTVEVPTWVVVNESRDGKPGNVLGASLFFPGSSAGTVTLLRSTVAGQTYFVTERKDNGDHRFSMSADSVITVDGQPSSATFSAN